MGLEDSVKYYKRQREDAMNDLWVKEEEVRKARRVREQTTQNLTEEKRCSIQALKKVDELEEELKKASKALDTSSKTVHLTNKFLAEEKKEVLLLLFCLSSSHL